MRRGVTGSIYRLRWFGAEVGRWYLRCIALPANLLFFVCHPSQTRDRLGWPGHSVWHLVECISQFAQVAPLPLSHAAVIPLQSLLLLTTYLMETISTLEQKNKKKGVTRSSHQRRTRSGRRRSPSKTTPRWRRPSRARKRNNPHRRLSQNRKPSFRPALVVLCSSSSRWTLVSGLKRPAAVGVRFSWLSTQPARSVSQVLRLFHRYCFFFFCAGRPREFSQASVVFLAREDVSRYGANLGWPI